ncbi:MAG: enterobactin/ferric enterobactin esterase [Candidatus Aminicenantes bacterium ADurb.Bin147]|nr:MAG: enterobactin/ferric enterobactin esterase [Candidatus Aminicenantes bacterium ADurb.Bin147]
MDGHDSLRKNWIPVLAFLAATLAGPAWSGTAVVFESLPGAATVVSIPSAILGETREVWIHVPQGYDRSDERYPVLIQLGAGPHFAYSAAIAEFLAGNGHIPPLIVVGLPDPTPRHHYRDSTPSPVDYLPASGGSPAFLRFLKEELLPYLETGFRTRPFRILCGHGLSGLFAVYALLESPGTFGGLVTDGASLAFDDAMIFGLAASKLAGPDIRGFLYLGSGNERETIPGLQRLNELLEKIAPPALAWTLEIEEDEDQGTAALPAYLKGLKWIYRGWRMPAETAAAGWDAVRAYYKTLSQKYGYEIPASEKALSSRGFQWIREQRFAEAETVFRLNEDAYPDSSQACLNLAFLYERMKDRPKAAAYYEKAAGKAALSQPEAAAYYKAQAERLRKK